MLRYHDYRRNTYQIGEIPATTLRRWQRLGRLLNNNDQDNDIDVEDVDADSDLMDYEELHNELNDVESDQESYSFASTPRDLSPDLESLRNHEDESDHGSTYSVDEFLPEDVDCDENLFKKLYENADLGIGESMYHILDFYIKNALTKSALYDLLTLINLFLPQPNNLPKTKHFLLKFIDSVLPDNKQIIKHRLCENCSEYLGDWNIKPSVSKCQSCDSSQVNGLFVEYDLKSALKNAFEFRNLKTLIDQFNETNEVNENCVSDITSSAKYIKLKEVIKGKYDLCLLWNTDGVPFSNSSNSQVWLVQAQIVNIPPNNRRNYLFVSGIYYSSAKKPNITSFLWPFVSKLKLLYEEGIDWYDRESNQAIHSTVIAPIASLDAPARAATQNIMLYNGEYGCTYCEHKGETCETGLGFNRVYSSISTENVILRTKMRMYSQAIDAVNESVEHVKGVKGPSVTAKIPFFDVSESFVPDYMHCILLGVSRMLFNLWFNPKNKNCIFYIKKNLRDEIDINLQKIAPPDFVTRTPRTLKHMNFWKASELRECLLNYFPILLKGKLKNKYYNHFLLLVYATRLVLQSKVTVREIEIADCLFNIFAIQVEQLYGLVKCSFNVHQLTHIARNVLLWGPLTSWSAFPFEDGNGYIKRLVHGTNKLDMEIANTVKILNAHKILKHKLFILNKNDDAENIRPLGSSVKTYIFSENELHVIQQFCANNNLDFNTLTIFLRVKVKSTVITSSMYRKQKKRNNFYIFLNDSTIGCVMYFFMISDRLFVVMRQLVYDNLAPKISVPSLGIEFSKYLIPFRDTYCIRIYPVQSIAGKLIKVQNYLCIPTNLHEKK